MRTLKQGRTLRQVEKEWRALIQAKEKLEKQIRLLWDEAKKLRTIEFYKNMPAEITPEFYAENYMKTDLIEGLYDKLQNWFTQKYGFNRGVKNIGDPRQGGIWLAMSQNLPVNQQDGWKDWLFLEKFGIMDWTCCQYESYDLILKPEIKLVNRRGSRSKEMQYFQTVEQAIEWIWKNLPYEHKT